MARKCAPSPEPGTREAPADNPFARAPAGGTRSVRPFAPRSSAPSAAPSIRGSGSVHRPMRRNPPRQPSRPIRSRRWKIQSLPRERDAGRAGQSVCPAERFDQIADEQCERCADERRWCSERDATSSRAATDNRQSLCRAGRSRVSAAAPAYEPADSMRMWTDVTGKHQVRGQMKQILVAEQKVRILKDTGKYTTVPFARLSSRISASVAHPSAESSALLAQGQ